MSTVGGEEAEFIVGWLRSSGIVRNIKGNVTGTDFVQFCSDTYPILIPSLTLILMLNTDGSYLRLHLLNSKLQ